MAKRRMLSIPIVETDKFYNLKSTAQALYLHLNLNADDDGVVDRVKSVMRDTRASAKNYQTLVDEGYIIDLGKGLALITHWNQHNKIKKDRYIPSEYHEMISKIELDSNGRYIKGSGALFGDKCAPQDRIGKDRLDKDSIVKDSLDEERIEKIRRREEKEEEKEKENYSSLHSYTTEEDLKISSDNGFADEPTGAEIDYGKFIAKVKFCYMRRHMSIDCNDFIRYYEDRNWTSDDGESVKANIEKYVDLWEK